MLVPKEARFLLELGSLIEQHGARISAESPWGFHTIRVQIPSHSLRSFHSFAWSEDLIDATGILRYHRIHMPAGPNYHNLKAFVWALAKLLRSSDAYLFCQSSVFGPNRVAAYIEEPDDSFFRSFVIGPAVTKEACFKAARPLIRTRVFKWPRILTYKTYPGGERNI